MEFSGPQFDWPNQRIKIPHIIHVVESGTTLAEASLFWVALGVAE